MRILFIYGLQANSVDSDESALFALAFLLQFEFSFQNMYHNIRSRFFFLQVLRFNAYFKQTVHESQNEYFRVRPVDIYYYLEDDSIAVIEPHVENCGMPQGMLL